MLSPLETQTALGSEPKTISFFSKSFSLKSGDILVGESRRGKISATTRVDEGMQKGVVMMPFSFNEAAANLITNEALDPIAKIPEFKYCAVKLSRGQRPDDAIDNNQKGNIDFSIY